MVKKINILLICFFFTSFSCSITKGEKSRETYFVESDGAFLPVFIVGPNTDKVILYVHGGPGSTSVISYYRPFFQELSKKYRLVFWDQRGSGSARGYISSESINIPQMVKDMDQVYKSVIAKYPKSKIYVYGESFGSLIGAAYVTQHNDKIPASIFTVPVFSIKEVAEKASARSLSFIDPYLQTPLSRQDNEFWQKAKKFYTDHPILKAKDFEQHQSYAGDIEKIQGLDQQAKNIKSNLGNYINDPLFEVFIFIPQCLKIIMALEKNGENNRNLITDPVYNLAEITNPILVVTGNNDYLVPPSTSFDGYKAFNSGTPALGSKYIMMQDASHYVSLQKEHQLLHEVDQFIKGN